MNWLDIAIVVVIAIATITGLRTGLIKAVLSLAGLIVGVILAGLYYIPLSYHLTFVTDENIARIAAFAIILIGVMIIAGVLAALLKWAASIVMMGWLNRVGGAVFGLALGAILCSALLAALAKLPSIENTITESTMATLLLDYFPLVLRLLPDEFGAIHSFF